MIYLASTFSPQMLSHNAIALVKRVDFDTAVSLLGDGFTSVVSHQVTAEILSGILNMPVPFNRINVQLMPGDMLIAIIPNFRAEVAREFTAEEIGNNFSFFQIKIQ